MNENTLAHPSMPRTIDTVSKVKLFETDHALALRIQTEAQSVSRTLTLQEIIREAVHVGLPAVGKRYKAMAEAARKADKES